MHMIKKPRFWRAIWNTTSRSSDQIDIPVWGWRANFKDLPRQSIDGDGQMTDTVNCDLDAALRKEKVHLALTRLSIKQAPR